MGTDHRQQGFSLIELMIAVTLSLVVGAAVISLLLQTKRSNLQNDNIARMQENARIAMQILREDLLHATFMGSTDTPTGVNTTTFAPTAPSPDCGPNGNAYTVGAISNQLSYAYSQTPAQVSAAYGCIASDDVRGDGTNVLVIKRAAAETVTPAANDNIVYVHANQNQGALYHNNGGAAPSFGTDRPYRAHIYYVDDQLVLSREYLRNGAAPAMVKEALVEGIEWFHVDFGIDSEGDGDTAPDYYTRAPTAAELANAVTARIYVLVQAPERGNDLGYVNDKIYYLGSADPLGPFNDTISRRVYATTVVLKNPRIRALMNNP